MKIHPGQTGDPARLDPRTGSTVGADDEFAIEAKL
jgi:hypothetical protein